MTSLAGDVPIAADGLAPDALARLLDERDRLLASRGAATVRKETFPILRMRVGDAAFGLPLSNVAGVTPLVRPVRLPGAPPSLLGIFAHDGVLHSLFSLRAVLGLQPESQGESRLAVVLRGPDPRVALAVDEAVCVEDAEVDQAPAAAELFRFAPLAGGGVIPLLDIDLLLPALAVRVAQPRGPVQP